jgi:elongation factor G
MIDPRAIHNIAFVGHPSAGKTTLVDAFAFATGANARKGSVADKTSICDTEPEEQERKHTLQMAVVSVDWGGKRWTFFDTPGYPEFVSEVQSATFASDLVVGVVSCASGVTFNARTKLADAKDLGRGRAIVVTHLDGENADFDTTVEAIREAVGEMCVPVLLPNASGTSFSAVRRTYLDPESEWCQKLKDRVMDACEDEELLMRYLDTQELSDEELDRLVPRALATGKLVPILVCNPLSGVGVDDVLDYFKRYSPTPAEMPRTDADGQPVSGDPKAPLVACVVNVKSDAHVGKVCLARIYSGSLTASMLVAGPHSEKGEKLGGVFRLVGKKREPLTEPAGPGEIVAFSKVEKLPIWSVFAEPGKDRPTLRTPVTNTPMVHLAVFPKSRADEQKIGETLGKLASEDPTFRIEHNQDTHELVVVGMSDLHLLVMFDRLKRRFGVEVETKLPRISYRETISRPSEGHHRHKKQSGGRGQFGECFLRLRPLPSGSGIVFIDGVVGGSIPRNLIPAVEKGIKDVTSGGILTHGQVVDVEAEVYDGKYHDVDSDEASFKIAGARAFRDGFEKGSPVLLEPIMMLEIRVPTEHAGIIFSDVTSHRRGHVVDQSNEDGGSTTVIKAEAPLQMVQTYHRELKAQTAGEGSYSMSFSRFSSVPASEQSKILAHYGKRVEEE